MLNDIYLLALLILVLVISLFWFINKKLTELKEASDKDDTLTEWLKSMQSSLEGTNKTLNQVISETNKNLNQALSQTNKNMVDSLQKSTKVINERLDNAAK